jgi:hypothetical protein
VGEHTLAILVKAVGTAQAARNLKGIDETVSNIGAHAGHGLRSLAGNFAKAGLIAGGALAGGVVLGVRSLAELERVTNLTKGVIESTGGAAGVTAEEVRQMAQDLEALTTADDKAIQSGQNMLLTFTNIGRDSFPQASKAMADMAIAMADGDVGSANFSDAAKQLGKALNDPLKGMTALQRMGVSFTEDQRDQIETLVKSGDTLGAQKIILAELDREFGKAGEAAGQGFGGDLRRLQDAGEDVTQALARGFLPVLSRAARWLNEKLADPATMALIDDIGGALADAAGEALDFAESIDWDAVIDAGRAIGETAGAVVGAFMALPDWVKQAVITGWGLNKLTGGALGGIVSELSKGLIKGVLGMNAGVVNLRAATVIGSSLPGAAGAAGAGAAGAGAAGVGGGAAAGAAAGGVLAPGVAPLAVGLAAPFAMFYGLPAITRAIWGPGSGKPEGGRVTGKLGSQPTAFTAGLENQIGALLRNVPDPTPAVEDVNQTQSETLGVTRDIGDGIMAGNTVTRDIGDGIMQNVSQTTDAARSAGMIGAMATGMSASRIVSAIASNRPTVNVHTAVSVTASNVQRSVATQTSYGAGNGSAFGGRPAPFE